MNTGKRIETVVFKVQERDCSDSWLEIDSFQNAIRACRHAQYLSEANPGIDYRVVEVKTVRRVIAEIPSRERVIENKPEVRRMK